jgi:hypothetical protein
VASGSAEGLVEHIKERDGISFKTMAEVAETWAKSNPRAKRP